MLSPSIIDGTASHFESFMLRKQPPSIQVVLTCDKRKRCSDLFALFIFVDKQTAGKKPQSKKASPARKNQQTKNHKAINPAYAKGYG